MQKRRLKNPDDHQTSKTEAKLDYSDEDKLTPPKEEKNDAVGQKKPADIQTDHILWQGCKV
jgi:hypothetical protein